MSWRTGVGIFCDIWPTIKEQIKDDDIRKEFAKDLIDLFEKYDIDRYDLEGFDDELDKLI